MAKKKGTRTRAEAKKLMWEYYRDNKASLPKWIVEFREEIISELINGDDVSWAFENVIEDNSERIRFYPSECRIIAA